MATAATNCKSTSAHKAVVAPGGRVEGDLIDGFGDREIDNAVDLYDVLRALEVGAGARVHVWRHRSASWGTLVVR